MSFGGWGIPPAIPFSPPPPALGLASTTVGRHDYQFSQTRSYGDNLSGVSDDVRQEVKISPGKYEVKEGRKYTLVPPLTYITNRISAAVAQQVDHKRKHAIDKRKKLKMAKLLGNSPSAKVKLEIYLERFDTGVFVTKVKVGNRERWQDVKYAKQALRFHSAIKRFQTVMSAVDTMKNYKTLHISLTREEAERYKAGDLLEGMSRPKPQTKPSISYKQVNNHYQQNIHVYNAGPSTSAHCIEDNDEFDSCFSDSSTD